MKIPEQYKAIDFWIERIGLPLLVAGFLAWLVVVKIDGLAKRMTRLSRNQKAMMEKFHIEIPPVEGER